MPGWLKELPCFDLVDISVLLLQGSWSGAVELHYVGDVPVHLRLSLLRKLDRLQLALILNRSENACTQAQLTPQIIGISHCVGASLILP